MADYSSHRPKGYERQGDSYVPKSVRWLRRALGKTEHSFAHVTVRFPVEALIAVWERRS